MEAVRKTKTAAFWKTGLMMWAIKKAADIINSHQESSSRQSTGCLKILVRQEDLEP
jgi:hypothetical protein